MRRPCADPAAGAGVLGRSRPAGAGGHYQRTFLTDSYGTVISRELEILGVSDHLRDELVTLMEFARQGRLDFDGVIAERLPLDAEKINARLDGLSAFRSEERRVGKAGDFQWWGEAAKRC